MKKHLCFTILIFCGLLSCRESKETTLFESISSKESGVQFQNTVTNTERLNIFSYRNFYNGGGVAIGDINNDGLPDIYFTANMGSNKLYLNKGNLTFEDISDRAGITSSNKWSTGVVMVDINADGLLDIYVCNAGYLEGSDQKNQLYINNGDLTFTEDAAGYGLDQNGYTTHAGFFDYDLDGDLDVYILNNSFMPVNTLNYSNKRDLRAEDWPVKDFLKGGGDKLFRNDDGKYVDVSEEAGIYGSLIGFGLGITIGDVNNDDFPDMYISNDFFERDYLYLNNQDGTFSEVLKNQMKHISQFSMGADMADINNDGQADIFVTDMLPDSDYRLKTTTSFDNWDVFNLKLDRDFYYQYMHNALQVNNGDDTFTESSFMSGVAASDWSWGALLFDADNDGLKDIFVSNGIYHDVINQDFIDFFANELMQKMVLSGKKEAVDSIINIMPSVPLANKAFRNKGNLEFEDMGSRWGFDEKTFSNGSAYGDLDNDGDLDLVVSNVNQEALIYRNNSESLDDHYFIKFQLKGKSPNSFAIGSKIELWAHDQYFTQQLIPSRGFQSSVDYDVVFGLGENTTIDSCRITWPDRSLSNIKVNNIDTIYIINQNDSSSNLAESSERKTSFFTLSDQNELQKHVEDDYVDFYYERNIPYMLSQEGPAGAVGDIDGDGDEDLYVGGASGQVGQIYVNENGKFILKETPDFKAHYMFEDVTAVFLDCDNDGDVDLYVGSGGNHIQMQSRELHDRMYLNDGQGNFKVDPKSLPINGMNTSVVVPMDMNKDGFLDLFVGSRNVPNQYGQNPQNYIFLNDGQGKYTDISKSQDRSFVFMGMITDALTVDLDKDGEEELVICGEWMSPRFFNFVEGKFIEKPSNLEKYTGWYRDIAKGDIDGDGDEDLIFGNMGENFYLKPTLEEPIRLWMADFDGNGSTEKILSRTIDGQDKAVMLKRDLSDQINAIKKQNLKHEDYANKSIQQLFSKSDFAKTKMKEARYFSSYIAYNEGNMKFRIVNLPKECQYANINALLVDDIDQDGDLDIIAGGNQYEFAPQFSRLDGSFGHFLRNDGQGNMHYVKNADSGLKIDGEVKRILPLKIDGSKAIIAIINNQKPLVIKLSDNKN